MEATAYRLPEKLEDRQNLREAIRAGLKQLEQAGGTHYHPKEPQARRMKSQGQHPFAYNAQAVVDQSCGVVVAAEVTDEHDDSNQLVGMAEQARQNTAAASPVLTVADGSYGTGAQIAAAVKQRLNVLVNPKEGGRKKDRGYSARYFHYDASTATVTCPQNQSLDFGGEACVKGQIVKKYRCHVADCPAAKWCKDNKGRRVIEIWNHTPAVQAMRARLTQASAQQQLKKRGELIERHFGHIKEHDGFRRWTVRGMDTVRTQWALLNLVRNLRVLYRHWKN